jgi:hypothetical protein
MGTHGCICGVVFGGRVCGWITPWDAPQAHIPNPAPLASHAPHVICALPPLPALQIKMLLGVLPSDDLLQKYKLTEYADVAKAVRTGDVGLLMRTLDANQAVLVQVGQYMTWGRTG